MIQEIILNYMRLIKQDTSSSEYVKIDLANFISYVQNRIMVA